MHTPAEGFEVAEEEEKCTQSKERDLLCAVQVKHAGHATVVGLCWNDDCAGVMHQTCLVLWTWRKLADETNAKNTPKIC